MKLTNMTDEQINNEINRLTQSPHVRLARAEKRAQYRRQQYVYQLRNLEKRGKELEALGFTQEDFSAAYRVEEES